jgi:hypothetical protein
MKRSKYTDEQKPIENAYVESFNEEFRDECSPNTGL